MQDEHLRKNMLKDLDIAIKVKRQNTKLNIMPLFRRANTPHLCAWWEYVKRPPPLLS